MTRRSCVPDCEVHLWVIHSTEGVLSRGACRRCGALGEALGTQPMRPVLLPSALTTL